MDYSIIVCKGCGRKFRIYTYEHYRGDPNYCHECNRKSEEPKGPIKWEKII